MIDNPAQAGLIISKSVGGSVVRHRVARQIRHALSTEIEKLPKGTHLVVRALTGSANQEIANDLHALILKISAKATATL